MKMQTNASEQNAIFVTLICFPSFWRGPIFSRLQKVYHFHTSSCSQTTSTNIIIEVALKDVINLLIPVSYFVTIQAYYSNLFMYNLSPNR